MLDVHQWPMTRRRSYSMGLFVLAIAILVIGLSIPSARIDLASSIVRIGCFMLSCMVLGLALMLIMEVTKLSLATIDLLWIIGTGTWLFILLVRADSELPLNPAIRIDHDIAHAWYEFVRSAPLVAQLTLAGLFGLRFAKSLADVLCPPAS